MKSPFVDLGLSKEIAQVLTGLGYEEPTPIQSQAIPPLLEGRDLLGQAATGTGKTGAFALPLLQRVLAAQRKTAHPAALVLVPTRELAIQVAEALHSYGAKLGAIVLPIYGGAEFGRQAQALKRGVHVVVATPGRALDHLRRGTLNMGSLAIVVLDEADEMLDMGFAEDIELILDATPAQRQTALFSATLPPRIAAIADKHLRDPVRVLIAREKTEKGALPRVRQTAYIVQRAHKVAALGRVLDLESPALALVFCAHAHRGRRTRREAAWPRLPGRGAARRAVAGPARPRDEACAAPAMSTCWSPPTSPHAASTWSICRTSSTSTCRPRPESYVHRIGRTGRAGREGVAITLAEPREHRLLRNIEQLTKQKIDVATVPTPMDVRARRLDMTRGALRQALEEGELDGYRVVTDALASEFDPLDVAAAAVKLAHQTLQADAAQDEEHIPSIDPRAAREPWAKSSGRPERPGRGRGVAADADPRQRPQERSGPVGPSPWATTPKGGKRPARPTPAHVAAGSTRKPARAATMVRVFVGAGRSAGLRPADLVGAIANEANISAREIGAIEIEERYSLVEVSDTIAEDAIRALRATSLRGQRVTVRRDQPKRSTR